jgi:hypothetical protein
MKIKSMCKISSLLIVLLSLSIVCMPIVSCETDSNFTLSNGIDYDRLETEISFPEYGPKSFESFKNDSNFTLSYPINEEVIETELSFPEYGPKPFESLKSDSNMIANMGSVPEITENKEKLEWLHKIEDCLDSSSDELKPYMKESGGPVVAFGTHYGGYLIVEFDKDLEGKIEESTLNNLYTIVNANAEKAEISKIPVVFMYGEEFIEESRSSYWRPLIGGIKITDSWTVDSTLSFAAFDRAAVEKGYVMSGHAAVGAGGVGATIRQFYPASIGQVDAIGGEYADAAWVNYDNVDCSVYYTDDDDVREVYNYTDPEFGSTVYKSGEETGKTSGTVTVIYKDLTSSTFGTLKKQFKASYSSDGGDSGAPVFTTTSSGKIVLYGVHWGSTSTSACFSPISGVISDLEVVPYTIYHEDWNPWNDPDSEGDSFITTSELQEATNCWVNDISAPITGDEVTTSRLQALVYYWTNDYSMPAGAAE